MIGEKKKQNSAAQICFHFRTLLKTAVIYEILDNVWPHTVISLDIIRGK